MNPVTMKVVVTGWPYHLAAEVAVVAEADAVVAEEGAGPGEGRLRPM